MVPSSLLAGPGLLLGVVVIHVVFERMNEGMPWWALARFRCYSHPLACMGLRWLDASRVHRLVSGVMDKVGNDSTPPSSSSRSCNACLLGSSTIARLGDFHNDPGGGGGSSEEEGNIINLGIEGLQTKHMLTDEFQHVWETRIPHLDVALVYVGINDAMFDPNPDDLAERIIQVLRLVQTRAQRVLYLPILESNFQRWGGARRLAYVRGINRLVRERCASGARAAKTTVW